VRFEKQLPFKFEIKYQRFNVREGLLGWYNFWSRLNFTGLPYIFMVKE
jgi:hypothetical protein